MMHLQPTPLTRIGPLLAAFCFGWNSQAANVAAESAALPSYIVCRTSQPIVVDGRLDEPAWSAAKSLGSFQFPWFQEGIRENSVVKLLWDAENLYIGCVCEDRHIAARAAEHDGAVAKDDCIEIMIAPDPSRPNRYFNVEWNVLGGYVDGHRPNGAEGGRVEWNAEGVRGQRSGGGDNQRRLRRRPRLDRRNGYPTGELSRVDGSVSACGRN